MVREEPITWGQGGILREVTGEKRTVADWPLDEVKGSKRHPRQFQMAIIMALAVSNFFYCIVFFSASFLFLLDFASFESALTNVYPRWRREEREEEECGAAPRRKGDKQLTFFMLASGA